jgi:hypothetical protein
LCAAAISGRAAATRPVSNEEPSILQRRLGASYEEWSVIQPQLDQIRLLIEEVNIVAPSNSTPARGRTGGMDSPMGGTSLDTPTVPASMTGPRRGFPGGSFPFDPNAAPKRIDPKNTPSRPPGTDTTTARRNTVRRLRSGQGNAVEALLSELQALLDSEGVTDAQLQEKLSSIRAARARALRELQHAQQDLEPLLTSKQIATLVSLGYLK